MRCQAEDTGNIGHSGVRHGSPTRARCFARVGWVLDVGPVDKSWSCVNRALIRSSAVRALPGWSGCWTWGRWPGVPQAWPWPATPATRESFLSSARARSLSRPRTLFTRHLFPHPPPHTLPPPPPRTAVIGPPMPTKGHRTASNPLSSATRAPTRGRNAWLSFKAEAYSHTRSGGSGSEPR